MTIENDTGRSRGELQPDGWPAQSRQALSPSEIAESAKDVLIRLKSYLFQSSSISDAGNEEYLAIRALSSVPASDWEALALVAREAVHAHEAEVQAEALRTLVKIDAGTATVFSCAATFSPDPERSAKAIEIMCGLAPDLTGVRAKLLVEADHPRLQGSALWALAQIDGAYAQQAAARLIERVGERAPLLAESIVEHGAGIEAKVDLSRTDISFPDSLTAAVACLTSGSLDEAKASFALCAARTGSNELLLRCLLVAATKSDQAQIRRWGAEELAARMALEDSPLALHRRLLAVVEQLEKLEELRGE